MAETTREKILTNLKNELVNIQTANGYEVSLAEVRVGIYNNNTITNFPTAIIMLGDDNLIRQAEGEILGESQLDVAVVVYLNATVETLAVETEKIIKDLHRFFSRDASIAKQYTSSLSELEYVMNYRIETTSPYITGANNMTACGIVLRIDYFNKIDSTSLPVPDAPDLVSPTNNYSNGIVKQIFNWNTTADAESYQIQISTDVNFNTLIIDQNYLSETSFTVPYDISLVNETTYYWRVRANGANESGDWSEVWSFTVNETNYDEDLQYWLDQLSVQPAESRIELLNTLISGLRSDGVWSKLDAFWVMANETEEQAKLNFKRNKGNLVPVNTPTFTVDRGYSTNGTTQYIRTKIAPKYQNNYTQNDASFGLYVNTNVDQNAVDMGCSWTVFNLLYTRVSNTIATSINDGGSTPTVANTSSIGFYAVDRQASANYKIYKNGTALATHSFVSTGLNDFEFFIGARNAIGTADRFASKRYALAFVGKGLTSGEHTSLYNRVNTYLTAIGAN